MELKNLDDLHAYVMNTPYQSDDRSLYSIKDYISDIKEHIHYINTEIDRLIIAKNALRDFAVDYKKESLDESIESLKYELDMYNKYIENVKTFLKDKQTKVCEHQMRNLGHDSHYEYYICDNCGFEERY